MNEKRLHVLVGVLNWGLGHATRCIPLIYSLLKQNTLVTLGGSGASLSLLRKEFPALNYLTLPGREIRYSSSGMSVGGMLLQLPALLSKVSKENKLLNALIEYNKIDLVISDNLYGLWSEKCYTVLI